MLTAEELRELSALALRGSLLCALATAGALALLAFLCWRSVAAPRRAWRRAVPLLHGLAVFGLLLAAGLPVLAMGWPSLSSSLLFGLSVIALLVWLSGRRFRWGRGFLVARAWASGLGAVALAAIVVLCDAPELPPPWAAPSPALLLAPLAWAHLLSALVLRLARPSAPHGYSGADLTAYGPFGERDRRDLAAAMRRHGAHAAPLFALVLIARVMDGLSGHAPSPWLLAAELGAFFGLSARLHRRGGDEHGEERGLPRRPRRHSIGFWLTTLLAGLALASPLFDGPLLPVAGGGLALVVTGLCIATRSWKRRDPAPPLPSGPMAAGPSVLTVPVEGIELSADDVANAFSLMGFRVRALELERGHVGGRATKERGQTVLSLASHVALVLFLSAFLAMYTGSRTRSFRLEAGATARFDGPESPCPWEIITGSAPPQGLPGWPTELVAEGFAAVWTPAAPPLLPLPPSPSARLRFLVGTGEGRPSRACAVEGPPAVRLRVAGRSHLVAPGASLRLGDCLVTPHRVDRLHEFRVAGPDLPPRIIPVRGAGELPVPGFNGTIHVTAPPRSGVVLGDGGPVEISPPAELIVSGGGAAGEDRRIVLEAGQSAVIGPWALTYRGVRRHVQIRATLQPMSTALGITAVLYLLLLLLRFLLSGYRIDFFIERLPGAQAMLHLRIRTRGLAADRTRLVASVKNGLVTEHESYI